VGFSSGIAEGGCSDHMPIVLRIVKPDKAKSFPFKLNESWLKEEELQSLVFKEWVPLSREEGSSFMNQFYNNLLKVGNSIKKWAKEFQKRSQQCLCDTEKAINYLLTDKPVGSLSQEEEKELGSLLIRKQDLLLQEEKEVETKE
jgi:hypothetical protein